MPEFLSQLLWVACGGAVGGMARFAMSSWVGRRVGESFPWGTLLVNGSGAGAAGVVGGCFEAGLLTPWPGAWPFLVGGFLASYTTVSAVSLQTLSLAVQGRSGQAAGNLGLSLLVCLVAVAAGYAMAGACLGGGP